MNIHRHVLALQLLPSLQPLCLLYLAPCFPPVVSPIALLSICLVWLQAAPEFAAVQVLVGGGAQSQQRPSQAPGVPTSKQAAASLVKPHGTSNPRLPAKPLLGHFSEQSPTCTVFGPVLSLGSCTVTGAVIVTC
jgi:hypothetical protein